MNRTYFVSTYNDADNKPLFVDITTNPVLTNDLHHGRSDWFESTATITYDRVTTLADADAHRDLLVAEKRPPFNQGE